jgi:hypothetical protein
MLRMEEEVKTENAVLKRPADIDSTRKAVSNEDAWRYGLCRCALYATVYRVQ